MEERGDLKIDVRKQMILDLTVFINELKVKHHKIILTIDANKAFDPIKGITKLVLEC